jgi:phospholipid/cholesterol/gamma-HCH transport system permease protein
VTTTQPRITDYIRDQLGPPLVLVGGFFRMCVLAGKALFRTPFQWKEFIIQCWFILRVAILPTMAISVPITALFIFTFNILLIQVGAADLSGAGAGIAVITQIGPLNTVLVIAGAASTAICADLGARTIREEIDAMSVLGVSPVHRLIVPRVWACVIVAVFLNGMVSVVGVAGGYVFNVLVQGGTPGAYLSSFSSLAQISDLYVGEIKAVVFGFLAAVVASYRGLHPRPGPKGVGDAVNESVVITFVLLFLVNLGITTLYLRIVPSKIT